MFITISAVLTSLIAALTVGGKAVCKTIAIYKSTDIIMFTGRMMYVGKVISRIFKIKTPLRKSSKTAV
ncbi:hypothetical protein [Lentibacillus sp. JNUCC-1]|uniref:hypothetical protein n=1 Tax=Lentibacillus sp. JNUCC-1 TaxID=2654513 RepID=UPI0012E87F4A|nr:hypothetical protein [Lentibacillus sp. JNUCC-1]